MAPDPHAPVGEWAGQMKSTTALQELVDMVDIDTQCTDRCDDNGNKKLTHMMCREHKQSITLFCKNCQATLCPSCREMEHQDCQSCVPIESMMPEITAQLTQARDNLTHSSQLISGRVLRRERDRKDLIKQKETTQMRIRSMCQMIIHAVQEREKLLLGGLELEAQELVSQIQLGIRLSERTATLQKHQSELIDRALHAGSDIDKYNMFKLCEKLYFEDEGSVSYGHKSRFSHRHNFENIDAVLDRVLGSVEVERETETPPGPDVDVDGVVVIKTEEDEEDPFPVDLAMVSYFGVHALVVTDNSNCCVKSFFIYNAVSHSRLSFNSPPWGLSKLMTKQVLIALPESKQIARVKVTPKLVLISKTATTKEYRSVTSLGPSTFAAGSSTSEEPCVDILDFNGRLLKSFTSHFPVQNPSYLNVLSNGKLVISDHGLGIITCISTEGRIDFTYKRDLEGPSGVAVTSSGDTDHRRCSAPDNF